MATRFYTQLKFWLLACRKKLGLHKHIPVVDIGKAVTCSLSGMAEGSHCSVCGEILTPQTELPPLGHTIVVDEAIAATCTKPGLSEGAHCAVCGEILTPQNEVPPLGHTIVIDEAVAATCKKSGLTEGSHCSVCGEILTPQTELSPLGHTIVIDETVAATCTKPGLSEGAHCAVCGEILAPQTELPPLGHTVVVDEAVAATCTKSGLTEGSHCSVCGEILTPQTELPPLGHTVVVDEAVAATCRKSGLTQGSHCSVCGEILTPQTELPPLGHTVVVDEAIAATCTKSGLTQGSHCSVCGEILTPQNEVPPLGHTIVIDEAVAATCTNSGLTQGSYCSVCGKILMPQTEVPPLGHTIVIDEAVAATCTKSGLTQGSHCSVCGEILVPQEEISPINHSDVLESEVNGHEEDFPGTEDVASVRLKQLTANPAKDWPLRRIIAFGANVEEYKKLKLDYIGQAQISMNLLASFKRTEKSCSWIQRLNAIEWDKAFLLCNTMAHIGSSCKVGKNVAYQRELGFSNEQISQKFQQPEIILHREYNRYINAVTDLFRQNMAALSFLYPNHCFDRKIAEAFFGTSTFNCIEHGCNLQKIHEWRSAKSDKAVGLQASLKAEASNKRTKVLSTWEHLEKYLFEQFSTQPILGNIELAEEEYEMLLEYMQKKLRNQRSVQVDRLICIGLVQIALRCPDSAFWPVVAEKMHCNDLQKIMSKFGHCFLNTMKHFRKATFATSEYVASIKMHTFVSNAYISDLFDFLFAYYELDLGRNMEFADLEELRILMISGNYFSRKQLIRQQTMDALKLIPDASLARMKTYLSWIDEAFWHQGWRPEAKDRFGLSFAKWCDAREEFNGQWAQNAVIRKKGKRMFAQPTIGFDTRSGQFYLVLPMQRLPFDCADATGWRVFEDERFLFDINCELIESITGCKTEEKSHMLSIDSLLQNFRIEFYNGNEMVRTYKLREDCVRIFNAQGIMLLGKHLPVGTTYFITDLDKTVETESEGFQQAKGQKMLKIVELQKDEMVIFPDNTLAIAGNDIAEGIHSGHLVESAQIIDKVSGQTYPLFSEAPSFLLKTSDEQFEKTRVQINDHFFTTQELNYRRIVMNDRGTESGYLVALPSLKESISFFHVNISIPGDSHARDWQLCCWKNFSCKFDNGKAGLPYWNTPRGSVSIDSDIFFSGSNLKKNPLDSTEYGFEIDPGTCSLNLEFEQNSKAYVLQLQVPAVAWCDKVWTLAPLGEVWHSDFPEEIDFHTQTDEIWMYVDRDGLQDGRSVCFKKRHGEDKICCNLLSVKQWLTRDKLMHTVHLYTENKSLEFAKVYCRSYLASAFIETNAENHTICGSFDIVGKGNYVVTLLYEQAEVLHQEPLIDGKFTALAAWKSGKYVAIVYEEFEGEFGFEPFYDEIGRTSVNVLNVEDLSGVQFHIKQVNTVNCITENLALREGRYQVILGEREDIEGIIYQGIMRVAYTDRIEDIAVRVIFPQPHLIDHCSVLFHDGEEWQPFLYDYRHQSIVEEENIKLPFMERYRRYTVLVPEDTCTIVYDA